MLRVLARNQGEIADFRPQVGVEVLQRELVVLSHLGGSNVGWHGDEPSRRRAKEKTR